MILFRSLLFLAIQIVFTAVFAVAALPAMLLPPIPRYRFVGIWARTVMVLARVILGIRYRVVGSENLPATGPAIVMSKHQSAWETIAYQLIFPPLSFVLKKELLRLPFFGWGLAMISPIAIDREAGREALRDIEVQGADRMAKGFWVLIFPEGTRVGHGEKGKYNIGGAWLAAKSGVPVIPVAHNAGRLWPKNALLKRPGEITVAIGPAIETAGKKPGAINSEVEAWIEAEMHKL
ncbi:MAG: lysophospholipid acyltransferase family protein [Gallionellaceae bacterium]|nr:lysophospholipid acyltransferase family protein [Gallionellaceae bacterium]MDD5365406.1 lysophospholipid acyltransferase family protein [Gallionellaceae bacterium]